MGKEDTFGEVIQYLDGYAWGVSKGGRTVCLGTETEIRDILAHPRRRPQNPTAAQVIETERYLSKILRQRETAVTITTERLKKERHKRAVELGVANPQKNKK